MTGAIVFTALSAVEMMRMVQASCGRTAQVVSACAVGLIAIVITATSLQLPIKGARVVQLLV